MIYCPECGYELDEWCLVCDTPYCSDCDSSHSDCSEPVDEDDGDGESEGADSMSGKEE